MSRILLALILLAAPIEAKCPPHHWHRNTDVRLYDWDWQGAGPAWCDTTHPLAVYQARTPADSLRDTLKVYFRCDSCGKKAVVFQGLVPADTSKNWKVELIEKH